MIRQFVAILVLCASAAAARAEIPVGFVEDGYTFSGNGLWRNGAGLYFTRSKVTTPGYYSYGCYYPATYYWSYSAYNPPHTPPAYTAPAYAPGWQEKVLDVAKARDDYATYLQALKALGLNGQSLPGYQQAGYGQVPFSPGYAYSGSLSLSSAGIQGTSIYGYSLKDLYGTNDVGLLYQQAARLTQNAQVLAGQAHGDFSDLVGQEGTARARVAEILARGQAAAQALQGANLPVAAKSARFTFTFRPMPGADAPQLQPSDPNAQLPPALAAWQQSAQRCASCHGAGGKGGFDVSTFPDLPVDKQIVVLQRLTTNDPAKRMPRNGDQPGEQLPPAEIGVWTSIIGRKQ